jgi:hypothetical protein
LLTVPPHDSEPIGLVIADVYPIDTSNAFIRKGWWPFKNYKQAPNTHVIADLQKGSGGHLIHSFPGESKTNKIKLLYY